MCSLGMKQMLAFALNGDSMLYSNSPSGEFCDADESANVLSVLGIHPFMLHEVEYLSLMLIEVGVCIAAPNLNCSIGWYKIPNLKFTPDPVERT